MQVFQLEAYCEAEVHVSTSQTRVLLCLSHFACPCNSSQMSGWMMLSEKVWLP